MACCGSTEKEDWAPDRDRLAMRYSVAKGAARERLAPGAYGGDHTLAWGGAQRLIADAWVVPSREDTHRYVAVPGRYVPIGYARYVSPVIDKTDFEYYRVAGWRVAVPRTTPGTRVRDLLQRIFYYGPQSAGYRRVGGTLVPAILGPGDRMMLSDDAREFEPYALSP